MDVVAVVRSGTGNDGGFSDEGNSNTMSGDFVVKFYDRQSLMLNVFDTRVDGGHFAFLDMDQKYMSTLPLPPKPSDRHRPVFHIEYEDEDSSSAGYHGTITKCVFSHWMEHRLYRAIRRLTR